MQISNNVAGIYRTSGTYFTGSSTTTPTAPTSKGVTSSGPGGIKTFDFSHMTRSQMRSVANDLFKSGQISIDDAANLTMIGPLGKAGPNGEFIPFTDAEREAEDNKPMNYTGIVKDHIAFLQQNGSASDPQSGYQSWVRLADELQRRQGTVSSVDVSA